MNHHWVESSAFDKTRKKYQEVMNSYQHVTKHRDLNFVSHKWFCTRDFACWACILDYVESKKDCLNSCRNRNFITSRDGIRTHDLR